MSVSEPQPHNVAEPSALPLGDGDLIQQCLTSEMMLLSVKKGRANVSFVDMASKGIYLGESYDEEFQTDTHKVGCTACMKTCILILDSDFGIAHTKPFPCSIAQLLHSQLRADRAAMNLKIKD